jgi:hypothetical protein
VNCRTAARALALPALVAISLVLAVGPVTAGSADHRGTWGVHFLADSREFPGVRCRYDSDQNLSAVRVRAPFVFAVDRASGVDRQRVGWQFVVQSLRDDPGSTWQTVERSSIQRAAASDATPADLSPMGFHLDTSPGNTYRVRVRMLWYRTSRPAEVAGVAVHTVRWYRYPLADANDGFCPGGIL